MNTYLKQTIQHLTEREEQVLILVKFGLSNKEISERLCINVGTVKRHLSNSFIKLNARNRTEAVNIWFGDLLKAG